MQHFVLAPSTGQDGHVFCKHGKSQKVLHTFPAAAPGITVEPLSDDPGDDNFLGFRLLDNKGKENDCYRADDIVQMRKFMASLGGTCPGLFTKKSKEDVDAPPVGVMARFNVIEYSADDLSRRQQIFDQQKQGKATQAIPAYNAAVRQLAFGFYFPSEVEVKPPPEIRASLPFSGSTLPVHDPSTPLPKATRRLYHDTFRPPYGPPVFLPMSIGYGSEVGLQPGQQALWDPNFKTYFFVDHVGQVTFYKDPRPPKEGYPTVKKLEMPVDYKKFAPNLVLESCKEPKVIEASAKRALSKPHGCVLNANGRRGPDGANGNDGAKGTNGANGSKGIKVMTVSSAGGRGGDGSPGHPGTAGIRGGDGGPGSDVLVQLNGDASALQVSGACNFTAHLGGNRAEEVLFVNCHGGSGGSGGKGGNGGHGGNGGRGGDGAKGQSGLGAGGNGFNGADGGAGGNGAPGGAGGKGGDGGHANMGGSCIIRTTDPELLVLVEADCLDGTPGKGGNGGRGGRGGEGGHGGCGGPGGSGAAGAMYEERRGNVIYRYQGPSGRPGTAGRQGINGRPGDPGKNGDYGKDGRPAAKGGLQWEVYSEGKLLYQAPTRYDAEVEKLNIVSAIDDGIFEPNEMIMVSGVLVVNSGGLPLPAGSSAFIPSTKTIKFRPTKYEVPGLMPNHVVTIPVTYCGRIFDQPSPNAPGPFVSSAEFHPRIELLGRPFEKSFLRRKLTVQYPVKLAHLKSNENLGQGEVSVLEIGVQNISSMAYGDGPKSGGKVALHIHLDARIIPVGCVSDDVKAGTFTVTYDAQRCDSMFVQLHKIPPKKTINVRIVVQMESRAELFDRCLWQADLYLRDKLIEYNFKEIRVAPTYIPGKADADALMITSQKISRKEFILWQRLLEVLNVKINFWDVDRHHGLSVDNRSKARHNPSWLGQYYGKLILYPHCDQRLQLLDAFDLVSHFHGPEYAKGQLEERESGMVLIFHSCAPHALHTNPFYDRGDKCVLWHLATAVPSMELPGKGYSGKHVQKPKEIPYIEWEKKQIKKMEDEVPSQSAVVISRQSELRKTGTFQYSYGTVDIRRIPLLHSSKLLVVDGAGGNMAHLSMDDVNLLPSATELPLASNYGQIFLAILYGLPLANKLALVKIGSEELTDSQSQVCFCLPNGTTLRKAELCMICAVAEIADEVLNCTGEVRRMGRLVEDVTASVEAYQANGQVVLRSMVLLKEELKVRKKRLNNSKVSRAVGVIKDQASHVERVLQKAGVNSHNLPPLPSFSILRDSYRVHLTAQHRMEDGRWNLLGQ